jgi:hypothetical protein
LLWDLTGLGDRRGKPAGNLTAEQLTDLWATLVSEDARAGRAALWQMVASPGPTVGYLKEKLRPVPPLPPGHLARLLKDLEADQFKTRERATRELEKLEEVAGPALRHLLEGRPPLEVQRRAQTLLDKLDTKGLSGQRLREIRAVEVLEQIGSEGARRLLQTLSRGEPEARLTREAMGSLQRLRKRAALQP